MRLNVKHKKTLTKTEKQKRINSEKKSKGPKLAKNYTDDSSYDGDNVMLDMTQMRYGVISSCDADYVVTNEGTIELKDSWLEFILISLYNVINNNKTTFQKLFEENEVTNMYFVVDKVYGKYVFDEQQYKAYNIYDTGYYLELISTSEVLFKAIVGLIKCMGVPLDQIKFHLKNKMFKDETLVFNNTEVDEVIVNIDDLDKALSDGGFISAVDMNGTIVNAHRLDVAFVAIVNILYDNYGALRLYSIPSSESTGIKEFEEGDELNSNVMQIRDSDIALYTDGNDKEIIKFISISMTILEIPKNNIRFKIRRNRKESEKKEWEIR